MTLRTLLDALPEPTLVVTNGRIRTANAAALGVFGTAIEGAVVRTAIRQPAAVERLLGAAPDAADEVERWASRSAAGR